MYQTGATNGNNASEKASANMSAMAQYQVEDLYSKGVQTILKKLDDFYDNPLEENIRLISIVEKILSYDVDFNRGPSRGQSQKKSKTTNN